MRLWISIGGVASFGFMKTQADGQSALRENIVVRVVFVSLAFASSVISLWPYASQAQSPGNSLSFAGKAVAIDMTSCSPDNSADGKSRAIAAMNTRNASSATVQFSTLNPAAGAYVTVDNEDALGPGKVTLGVAGPSFGDGFIARPGQTVNVAKAGSTYRATFSDVVLVNMMSKAVSTAKLTGDFSCK